LEFTNKRGNFEVSSQITKALQELYFSFIKNLSQVIFAWFFLFPFDHYQSFQCKNSGYF